MNTLRILFRCIRLASISVYVAFFLAYVLGGGGTAYSDRAGWTDVLAVMTIYSLPVLLVFCLGFLFIDRKAAFQGFAVLGGGILVGILTPRF